MWREVVLLASLFALGASAIELGKSRKKGERKVTALLCRPLLLALLPYTAAAPSGL